jgi:hypothetical protein
LKVSIDVELSNTIDETDDESDDETDNEDEIEEYYNTILFNSLKNIRKIQTTPKIEVYCLIIKFIFI